MAAAWLTALFVALFFGFILYRSVFPRRRPMNELVFWFQALLVPTLGLAFYVVTVGPPPQSTWLAWPATALVAGAVLLAVLNLRLLRRLRSGLITPRMLAGQHRLTLARQRRLTQMHPHAALAATFRSAKRGEGVRRHRKRDLRRRWNSDR